MRGEVSMLAIAKAAIACRAEAAGRANPLEGVLANSARNPCAVIPGDFLPIIVVRVKFA
jgi:hypothetical protein